MCLPHCPFVSLLQKLPSCFACKNKILTKISLLPPFWKCKAFYYVSRTAIECCTDRAPLHWTQITLTSLISKLRWADTVEGTAKPRYKVKRCWFHCICDKLSFACKIKRRLRENLAFQHWMRFTFILVTKAFRSKRTISISRFKVYRKLARF